MARRTFRCKRCSGVLEKEQRKEGVCQYCQLRGKVDKDIKDRKHSADEPLTRQLEELEIMALGGVKEDNENVKVSESESPLSEKHALLDENENAQSVWRKDNSLPEGWKTKIDLNRPQSRSVISPDEEIFDSFLNAYIHMAMNQETYENTDIDKMKACLTEEGWDNDQKLPSGWKISRNAGDNIFVLLSKEGVFYQTLDAAHEFMEDSDEYDETDVLNVEELCMGILEAYVSEMNITPDSPVKSTPPKIEREKKKFNILTRGTQFPCDLCGKSFRTKSKLTDHASVHAGFKPYQCVLCQKAYSLKENLKAHMTNHKKEVMKLHNCQVCSKPFYYLSKIIEHMEEAHPFVFPYNCNVCDQNFSRSETLRIHKKNHTSNAAVPTCTNCNKSFQTNYSLKRHNFMFHQNKNV
eukprot:GFUD01016935.1.p1 GENE.GFUD01016935.1~~GFUD01016935.1.p1  ORF type:complete len:409 (-),score=87.94 GFUD01016935.1:7-1233(-)